MTFEDFVAVCESHPDLFTTAESNEVFPVIGKVKTVKSSLFNKTPRQQKINTLNGLSCKIVDVPIESCGIPFRDFDNVAFICDKEIDLNGFIMWAASYDDFTVDILISEHELENISKVVRKLNDETRESYVINYGSSM